MTCVTDVTSTGFGKELWFRAPRNIIRQPYESSLNGRMRTAAVAVGLTLVFAGQGSAEQTPGGKITPVDCKYLADKLSPLPPPLDKLIVDLQKIDFNVISSRSDGRLKAAAAEADAAKKDFLRSTETFSHKANSLIKELRNCQNESAESAE